VCLWASWNNKENHGELTTRTDKFLGAYFIGAFHHPPPKPDSAVVRIWLFCYYCILA